MDKKLKYGVFASLLLWPLLAAALVDCYDRLPTTNPANPFAGPHDTSHNWIGQGTGAAYGNALLLLLVIYISKFLIAYFPIRWIRVYFFALLVIASLPFIWLLVVVDWQNPHVYRIACWLYDPIGIWFIPMVSFAADTVKMSSPQLSWYVGRSCIELLLQGPWILAWIFISFFFLGGGWI